MKAKYFVAALLLVVSQCIGAQDQLEQEPILIKGNQGLPRTLYIAPWKRVGAPLASGALEGNIGEAHEPLERDLFLHELELRQQGYSVDSSSTIQATPAASPAVSGAPTNN